MQTFIESKNSYTSGPFVFKVADLDIEVKEIKIKTEPAGDETQKLKRRQRSCFKDEELFLVCEWGECSKVYRIWHYFQQHVEDHLNELVGGPVLYQSFTCLWTGCGWEENNMREMARHLNFHFFHSKLKCHAKNILNSKNWSEIKTPCTNFPKKLPKARRFKCEWEGCTAQDVDWLQPIEFFNHVYYSHNRVLNEDYSCKWKGCDSQKYYNKPAKYGQEYFQQYPSKFREHLRSHTKEKMVACPTCGSMFANRIKFYDHCRRQEFQEVSFPCGECGKQFPSARIFKDHARSHMKPYSCSLCPQTCPSPSTLRKHIIYKHTDEKPFSCPKPICGFRTKTDADLKSHERKHTKRAVFCDSCEFSCKNSNTLRHHVKDTHSNMSTTYACHLCDFRVRKAVKLSGHLASHGVFYSRELSRFIYKLNLQTGLYQLRADMAPAVLPTPASAEPSIPEPSTPGLSAPEQRTVKSEDNEEQFDLDSITNLVAMDVKKELMEMKMNEYIDSTESDAGKCNANMQEMESHIGEDFTIDMLPKKETKQKMETQISEIERNNKEKYSLLLSIITQQIEVINDPSLGKFYKCKKCERVNSNKYALRSHIETHLEGVKYECLNCCALYKTRNALTTHMSTLCKIKGSVSKYIIHVSQEGIRVINTAKKVRLRVDNNKTSTNKLDDLFDYSMFMGSIG